MRYYIDGYNLMFRTRLPSSSFSEKRNLILVELKEKLSLLDLQVVIIFDAQYTGSEELPHHLADLEVRYTSRGETTDEWILSTIIASRTPHKMTIITSDRALAQKAKKERAEIMTVEAFNVWIDKKYQRKLKSESSDPPHPGIRNWWIDYYMEIFQKRMESGDDQGGKEL